MGRVGGDGEGRGRRGGRGGRRRGNRESLTNTDIGNRYQSTG